MSQSMQRAREDSSGFRAYLLGLYYVAASNLSITTMVFGAALVVLGATVVNGYHDVFAGMFGIWGASFVLLGGLAYAVLWANRVYARLSE